MKYTPIVHHRRSIRIKGYDYSQAGAYFVTICTQDRKYLFGDIKQSRMLMNYVGHAVVECWNDIQTHFPHVELDEFIVMPNHIHGVAMISDVGARHAVPLPEQFGKPVSGSLPTIIWSFKSAVTKHINELRQTPGSQLWQRNYWEHIIRNEQELNRIREYIRNNPMQWGMDRLNSDRLSALRPCEEIWMA
jgi:putative transposase